MNVMQALPRIASLVVIVLSAVMSVGCSGKKPVIPPPLNIALEKVDSNRPPLGAKLLIKGNGFTPGGQALITITNTSPDGTRQTLSVPVDSSGRFFTAFPFQCISYSKQYADLDMLASVRDTRTGKFTASSIKAGGFWVCQNPSSQTAL